MARSKDEQNPQEQEQEQPQQFGDPVEPREPDEDPIGAHVRRPDDQQESKG